ncbi:hypothetical protein [Varibaculum prostatecancerukia]|uniref:hypothetical protein n=1 Tax=Varibaculum prostatecancerukia TaxID=2811781 RepID=UPI001BFFF2CA|nr:hypothetical protein [Varibaculum prostatecancerukia]
MNHSPGNDDEGSKTGNLHFSSQHPSPYGPPGRVIPARQPGTSTPLPASPPHLAGQATGMQPAPVSPAALPGAIPATYPHVNPACGANSGASGNPNLVGQKTSSAHNGAVMLIVIGIVIAVAYLAFLLFILVKTHFMALPTSFALPVSIITLAEHLGNITSGLW